MPPRGLPSAEVAERALAALPNLGPTRGLMETMTLDELLDAARQHRFSDLAAIRRLVRGAVVLGPAGELDGAAAATRLGGLPDLPPTVQWPTREGRSLAFIARIELASQPGVAAREGLPENGRLLFFYDAEQGTWGHDPADAGSFAVIYVPDGSGRAAVVDWPDDLPEHARYAACALSSAETVTLPPRECALIDELALDAAQRDAYLDLLDEVAPEDQWAARALLGGYPDQIQGDMARDCVRVTGGGRWRLLLQVPSLDASGMMWGDLGCLYFWIRDDDLAARRFDRCWMILQCS